MTILVLFATTDGQTSRIARRAADHLAARGHVVDLRPVAEAEGLDLAAYDRAVLAASLHAGRYQTEFASWVTARRDALARLPTAFLSVSLSAASTEPEDREGLADCLARMVEETGWRPGVVEHVAGAFRFEAYGLLQSWAMRWIERRRDPGARPGTSKEYTDWDALARFLDGWAPAPATATAPSA